MEVAAGTMSEEVGAHQVGEWSFDRWNRFRVQPSGLFWRRAAEPAEIDSQFRHPNLSHLNLASTSTLSLHHHHHPSLPSLASAPLLSPCTTVLASRRRVAQARMATSNATYPTSDRATIPSPNLPLPRPPLTCDTRSRMQRFWSTNVSAASKCAVWNYACSSKTTMWPTTRLSSRCRRCARS